MHDHGAHRLMHPVKCEGPHGAVARMLCCRKKQCENNDDDLKTKNKKINAPFQQLFDLSINDLRRVMGRKRGGAVWA